MKFICQRSRIQTSFHKRRRNYVTSEDFNIISQEKFFEKKRGKFSRRSRGWVLFPQKLLTDVVFIMYESALSKQVSRHPGTGAWGVGKSGRGERRLLRKLYDCKDLSGSNSNPGKKKTFITNYEWKRYFAKAYRFPLYFAPKNTRTKKAIAQKRKNL